MMSRMPPGPSGPRAPASPPPARRRRFIPAFDVSPTGGLDAIFAKAGREWTAEDRIAVKEWLEANRRVFAEQAQRAGDNVGGCDSDFGQDCWADFRARGLLDRTIETYDPRLALGAPITETPSPQPARGDGAERSEAAASSPPAMRNVTCFVAYLLGREPMFASASETEGARLLRPPAGLRGFSWARARRSPAVAAMPEDGDRVSVHDERADVDGAVWAAVERMSPADGVVLDLEYLRDVGQLESAVLLGISYEALRTRLVRARDRLARVVRWAEAQDLALAHYLGGVSIQDLGSRVGVDERLIPALIEEGRALAAHKLLMAGDRRLAREEDRPWLATLLRDSACGCLCLLLGVSPTELARLVGGVSNSWRWCADDGPQHVAACVASAYGAVARARTSASLSAPSAEEGDGSRSALRRLLFREPHRSLLQRLHEALGQPLGSLPIMYPGLGECAEDVLDAAAHDDREILRSSRLLLGKPPGDACETCRAKDRARAAWPPAGLTEELAVLRAGTRARKMEEAVATLEKATAGGPWTLRGLVSREESSDILPGVENDALREAVTRLLARRHGELQRYWQ